MRTKDELFREALRHITARRQRVVMLAETARRAAYAAHPEIAEAEAARTRAGLALALVSAGGKDTEAARAALDKAEKNIDIVIAACGCRKEDFTPKYVCPVCKDTGLTNGAPCTCVAELARTLRREEINAASPLALCAFNTFEVTRYSDKLEPELGCPPRDYMTKLLQFCHRYADNFSAKSPNLLFMGGAGLGKTHMALAIADTVLARGYDVLYTSSAALAAQLGREHFDRDSDDPWLAACKEADLLILDDLGTEYINQLTISVLYELINTRMLCHRPIVYTTNIVDHAVLEARYTEKVASRMLGNCKMFKFFGEDQRLK